MRISDWSSACALPILAGEGRADRRRAAGDARIVEILAEGVGQLLGDLVVDDAEREVRQGAAQHAAREIGGGGDDRRAALPGRKSVVSGKRVAVREEIGGRRSIKKKNEINIIKE